MSDVTPLFQKYVTVFKENLGDLKADADFEADYEISKEHKLDDTFIVECKELLKLLLQLRKVLREIEPDYRSDGLDGDTEKDEFETEFRLQLQKYVQKFKQLKNYEERRQQLVESQLTYSKKIVVGFLQGRMSSGEEQFYKCNGEFRNGILQSLNLLMNSISTEFSDMQQERLEARRKFQDLVFNVARPDIMEPAEPVSITMSSSKVALPTQEEVKNYEDTISKLSQEQIQLLETEHEELLNHKNEQLKKMEKITQTIMETVALQTELSTHLNIQSHNISNIMDNQDDIEVNIKEGNKQLTKAKKAAGRTAKITTYTAILFGIMILLLDYIS